uniref:Helitron helicase-like domain-containing protein n=1 Tax=Phlebotomus papatasi TaxID=29031 RepID=A0A1B0D6S3_PHLPP
MEESKTTGGKKKQRPKRSLSGRKEKAKKKVARTQGSSQEFTQEDPPLNLVSALPEESVVQVSAPQRSCRRKDNVQTERKVSSITDSSRSPLDFGPPVHFVGIDEEPVEIRENNIIHAGVRVLLPSTFPGSPRNMHQRYVDAMAMMAELGKPDLFITMSCNPSWPEITNNIQPHMNSEDQVVLACRYRISETWTPTCSFFDCAGATRQIIHSTASR